MKKLSKEKQQRRQAIKEENQQKRIESAENLLQDMMQEGAELLELERSALTFTYESNSL